MGQPVLDRYMEAEIRPKAFEELGRQIQVYMKFIEAYKAKVTNIEQQRVCFLFVFNCIFVSCKIVKWFLCVPNQDEQYNHLDELEVTQVEKQVNDAMAWMNNKMNQQNGQDLTLDPVVKVQEIQAKAKVQRGTQFEKNNPESCVENKEMWVNECSSSAQELYSACNPVVSKPKPKVELPKEEETENGPVNGHEGTETQSSNPDKTTSAGMEQETAETKLPEMDID